MMEINIVIRCGDKEMVLSEEEAYQLKEHLCLMLREKCDFDYYLQLFTPDFKWWL